jgi:tetratricopeptide (TPR) repeat protein
VGVQVYKLPDQEIAIKFKLTPEWLALLKELQKRREALGEFANWRPLWERVEEVALAYYMQSINRSLTAKLLGISEKTLERLNRAVEVDHQVPIYDPNRKAVVRIEVKPEDLIKMIQQPTSDVEQLLEKYEKLKEKKILTQFAVIREFINNPVRIKQKSRKTHYNAKQVQSTLNAIAEVLMYLKKNKDKYKVPLNPDMWSKEHEMELVKAIEDLCREKGYITEKKLLACRASYFMRIRRIERFYRLGLFDGMVGRVLKRVEPRSEFMSLEQYRKLYEEYVKTTDNDYRAWFEIMSFHLLLGSREGYGSIETKIYYEMNGSHEMLREIDLDSEVVETSLIGVKWDNVIFTQDNDIMIKVYESKTGETWSLNSCWIGEWFVKILRERYEFAKKHGIKSVVKTILVYYNINATTITAFERWYQSRTKMYTRRLIGVELTPHRIRASHISILYELGVPLELAAYKTGFGVGWADLSTAVEFYWRLTSQRIKEYVDRAREKITKTLFA